MSNPRIVSPSPHIFSPEKTGTIMWWVVLALLPLMVTSTTVFGLRSLAVIVIAAAACVITEYLLTHFVLRRQAFVGDGSAVVTGILLAANLPVTIPIYQIVIGAVVAIGIGKVAFGGIGSNPFNPALVGRAFLLVSYPADMTKWVEPGFRLWFSDGGTDAATAATPLGVVAEGSAAEMAAELPSFVDLFWGSVGGTLGGVGVFAVLLGGGLLIVKRIIDWQVPVTYLAALAAVSGLAWLISPAEYVNPLFHVMAGGAMLGAFFMLTDFTTSPMTLKGRVVFAAGAGVITAIIRLFAALPDGVAYSILFMNALVPLLDRWFRPKPFGRPWTPPAELAAARTAQENGNG